MHFSDSLSFVEEAKEAFFKVRHSHQFHLIVHQCIEKHVFTEAFFILHETHFDFEFVLGRK
jgi:hypothetical protein